MNIYTLNLVVNTKNTDIYDKVALNKFPMIIKCKSEEELKDILKGKHVQDYVKNMLKSKRVSESAQWMIREVSETLYTKEFILPLHVD